MKLLKLHQEKTREDLLFSEKNSTYYSVEWLLALEHLKIQGSNFWA